MIHRSGRDFTLMILVAGKYQLLDGEISLSGAVACEYVENSIKRDGWNTTTPGLGVQSVSIKADGVYRTDPTASAFKVIQEAATLGDSLKFRIASGVNIFLEGEAVVDELSRDNNARDAQRYSFSLQSISKILDKDSTPQFPETCTVGAPYFYPESGEITVNQDIVIQSPTSSATIYYTIDGTDPSLFGVVYTGPFRISIVGLYQLRAYAVCEEGNCGCQDSTESSTSFNVVPDYAGETWAIEGGAVGVSTYTFLRNRTIGPSYTIAL